MDNLTKREKPDRSKINMHEAWELDHWTRELGVNGSLIRSATRLRRFAKS